MVNTGQIDDDKAVDEGDAADECGDKEDTLNIRVFFLIIKGYSSVIHIWFSRQSRQIHKHSVIKIEG